MTWGALGAPLQILTLISWFWRCALSDRPIKVEQSHSSKISSEWIIIWLSQTLHNQLQGQFLHASRCDVRHTPYVLYKWKLLFIFICSLSSLVEMCRWYLDFFFPHQYFFFLRALFTSLLFLVMTTLAQLTRGGIMKRVGFCNVLMHLCQIQRSKRVNKTLQLLLKKMNPKLSSLTNWFQSVSFTMLNFSPPHCIVKN